MRWLSVGLVIILLSFSAYARNDGRWNKLALDQRDWLRRQLVPGGQHKGNMCCNEADGVDAQEDIRYDAAGVGHYWVKFIAFNKETDWTPVPDDAVIQGPNPVGTPVVWYTLDNSGKVILVRCYAPGAKM